jgi:hypothetical protein
LENAPQNAKKWKVKKTQELKMWRKGQGRPKNQTTKLCLLVIIVFKIMLFPAFDFLFTFIFDLGSSIDERHQKATQKSQDG